MNSGSVRTVESLSLPPFSADSSGRRRVFIKKAIPPPSRNGKNSVPILPTTLTTLPKFISAHASRISSASEQKTWRRSLRSSRNVFGSAEVSRCSY